MKPAKPRKPRSAVKGPFGFECGEDYAAIITPYTRIGILHPENARFIGQNLIAYAKWIESKGKRR